MNSLHLINEQHREHLLSEGFTLDQIETMQAMGVRSITEVEASAMGFRIKQPDGSSASSSGLYFPFADGFGQIRADNLLLNRQGKPAKYLTPVGAKSQAMIPVGCKVITEGAKDALAGTMHGGLPTGALAGVSHALKALKPCSSYVFLFDADGRTNPNVFRSLVVAAVHGRSKIQLVPAMEGQSPKAGLCEYFKAGHTAADYQKLIASAMSIPEFLLTLPSHWIGLGETQVMRCVEVALALAAVHLSEMQQTKLLDKIHAATKIVSRTALEKLLRSRIKLQAKRREKEREKAEQADRAKQKGRIPGKYNRLTGEMQAPEPSTVAGILSEAYRTELAFDAATEQFYRYGSQMKGVWSIEPMPFIQQLVQAEMDASQLQDCYSGGYISSVINLMQGRLAVRRWDEARGLLPMQNGVLDLATRKLLPHSPGYRFTWQLPYDYDATATCEPIEQWMLDAQDGDKQRVQLLRAFLKAIVEGRTDFQRFLECLGPGGTGKSTYTRLATALVGLQNTFVTELKQLESNRFETAGIRGKKLVVISDSERYGGTVTVLKSLTGQDMIRDEQKFRQQGSGFVADAMVLIAANEAIQSSDYTSGLERRRLTIPFLNEVAPQHRRDLLTITHLGTSGEFVPYLPGLLNWVLDMPDEQMRSLIVQTQVTVPSLARWKAESLMEANPIAEWLDGHLILDSTAKTYVGVARKIRVSEGEPGNTTTREYWENANQWLYPSYVQNCHDLGNHPISVKRFVKLLEDLLRSQLHFKAFRGRDRDGSYFEGIAIRSKEHQGIKRPISGGFDRDDGPVTVSVTGCDGTVTAESLTDVGFDGCDGFSKPVFDQGKAFYELPPIAHTPKINSALPGFKEENPSHPSKASLPTVSAVTHPVTATVQPSPNPSHLIQVGDRVEYIGKNSNLQSVCRGLTLEVAAIGDDGIAYLYHERWHILNKCPIAEVRRVEA
jgi:P4 family phage/plasmid primase-like protien